MVNGAKSRMYAALHCMGDRGDTTRLMNAHLINNLMEESFLIVHMSFAALPICYTVLIKMTLQGFNSACVLICNSACKTHE